MSFQGYKTKLVAVTGLEKDALHVYVGLGVFLLGLWLIQRCQRLLARRGHRLAPPRDWLALLVVWLLAMLGESLDYREAGYTLATWDYRPSVHDIVNTCFWPAVLYGLMRWTPLFKR